MLVPPSIAVITVFTRCGESVSQAAAHRLPSDSHVHDFTVDGDNVKLRSSFLARKATEFPVERVSGWRQAQFVLFGSSEHLSVAVHSRVLGARVFFKLGVHPRSSRLGW